MQDIFFSVYNVLDPYAFSQFSYLEARVDIAGLSNIGIHRLAGSIKVQTNGEVRQRGRPTGHALWVIVKVRMNMREHKRSTQYTLVLLTMSNFCPPCLYVTGHRIPFFKSVCNV